VRSPVTVSSSITRGGSSARPTATGSPPAVSTAAEMIHTAAGRARRTPARIHGFNWGCFLDNSCSMLLLRAVDSHSAVVDHLRDVSFFKNS
jgi:hypothetical protein